MPVILNCGECPLAQRARTLGWPAVYCPLFLPSMRDVAQGLRLVVSRRLGIPVADSPPDPRGHPIRLLFDGPVRCPSLVPDGAEPGQVASSWSSYVPWLVRRKLPWLPEAEQEELAQDVFLDLSRTAARQPRGEEVLNIARLAVHSRARERIDRRECRSCLNAHRQDEGNPQTDPLVCGMTAWPDGRSLLVRGSLRPPVESWCLRMDGERVPYDPVTMSSLRCDRCLDAIPLDWIELAQPAAKGSRAGSAPVKECRCETGVYRGRIVSAELRESAMGCGSFQIVEDTDTPVTVLNDHGRGQDYRAMVDLLRGVEARLAGRFAQERPRIDEMETAGRAYGFEPRFRPVAARLCFRHLFVFQLESASGVPGADDLAGTLVALGVHVAPVREDLTVSRLRRSAGSRRMPRPLLPGPRPWEGRLTETPGDIEGPEPSRPWFPLLGWILAVLLLLPPLHAPAQPAALASGDLYLFVGVNHAVIDQHTAFNRLVTGANPLKGVDAVATEYLWFGPRNAVREANTLSRLAGDDPRALDNCRADLQTLIDAWARTGDARIRALLRECVRRHSMLREREVDEYTFALLDLARDSRNPARRATAVELIAADVWFPFQEERLETLSPRQLLDIREANSVRWLAERLRGGDERRFDAPASREEFRALATTWPAIPPTLVPLPMEASSLRFIVDEAERAGQIVAGWEAVQAWLQDRIERFRAGGGGRVLLSQWGSTHVEKGGLRRFLRPQDQSVCVILNGGRFDTRLAFDRIVREKGWEARTFAWILPAQTRDADVVIHLPDSGGVPLEYLESTGSGLEHDGVVTRFRKAWR